MKITCNSCGSKYTIADAKVQGKKVKVRCKGCGENILVDGSSGQDGEPSDPNATEVADEDQSPAEAPTAAAKKGLWSVNLTDDDSRDMTLQELVAAWKAGVVTQDAYVWKDGMGDWKPILEVEKLKLKLGPAPKKGAPGVVSSAAAGAKAPRAADKMDDLFGGADADSKPEPAKPALGGAADKATGARNDSSVLFSLDSLNQPAAGAEKPQAAGVDIFGGMSGGIGTLGASNVDLLTAPAKDPPPAPAGARLAPAVAVMPMAAPAPKSKTGLIIGAAIVVVLLIGGGVFAMSGSDDGSAEVDEKLKAAEAEAEKARKEAAEAKQKIEEERKKLEEEKKKALEDAKKAAEAPKADDKKEEEKKEEAKPGDAKPGTSPGTAPAPATDPAPAASGKPPFDVGAAKAALAAAAANAAGCRKPGGPTGSGRVQLTFGTSGRVSSASVVSGPFGGTAVGGCIVSAFRNARVPAFTGTPQTVSKSFSVK